MPLPHEAPVDAPDVVLPQQLQTDVPQGGLEFIRGHQEAGLEAALTGIAATLQHQAGRLELTPRPLVGSAESADEVGRTADRQGVFYDKVTQGIIDLKVEEGADGGPVTYTVTERFAGPKAKPDHRDRRIVLKATPQDPADHEFVSGSGAVRELDGLIEFDEVLTRAQPVPEELADAFIAAHGTEDAPAGSDAAIRLSGIRLNAGSALDKAADEAYVEDGPVDADGKPVRSARDIRTRREKIETAKTVGLVAGAAGILAVSGLFINSLTSSGESADAGTGDTTRYVTTDRGASAERPDGLVVDVTGGSGQGQGGDGRLVPGTVEQLHTPPNNLPDPRRHGAGSGGDIPSGMPGVNTYFP